MSWTMDMNSHLVPSKLRSVDFHKVLLQLSPESSSNNIADTLRILETRILWIREIDFHHRV